MMKITSESVYLHWILYVVAAVVLGHEISYTKAEELLVPYSLTGNSFKLIVSINF